MTYARVLAVSVVSDVMMEKPPLEISGSKYALGERASTVRSNHNDSIKVSLETGTRA